MSVVAPTPEPVAAARRARLRYRVPPPPPASIGPALAAAIALLLIGSVAIAGGGLQLRTLTVVEVVIDVLAGAVCAAALVLAPGPAGLGIWARVALGAFALLAAFTGLSIVWSIDPSGAWIEANRTFTLLATFAAGTALARLAPRRWRALLAGVLIAASAVSLYALMTKVFPSSLAPDETYARLEQPFEYWNAVGLLAAMGVPCALWLGTRREGHGVVNALSVPVLAVLLMTILVAYSRGALVAVVVGCALWLWLVPLRLRSAAILAPATVVAVLVSGWTFTQNGLDKDKIPLPLRSDAGTEFGFLLLACGIVLFAVGLGIVFWRHARPISHAARRAWGISLLVALALVPVAAAGMLATTDRGLTGSISHGWHSLTDPNANTPPNDPSRLTAVGSVRARYWREAIEIFKERPAVGVGAGGYSVARTRVRHDTLDVKHAHGYLVQTAADLGLVGLLLSLVLLGAWITATLGATGLRRRSASSASPVERAGLITLATVVVVFGVHSLVDWTWFIPGTALPAMLCAGWLIGREPGGQRGLTASSPLRAIATVLVAAAALAGAVSATRPERSASAIDNALAALADRQPGRARAFAQDAIDANPLAVEPLFTLSRVETTEGQVLAARMALEHAVQLQPANPDTWIHLSQFELATSKDRAAAKRAVTAALYLDPRSTLAQALYLAADKQRR